MMAKGRRACGGIKQRQNRHASRARYATYTKLAVVLDGLLVIFLHIIREVVDWDVVVLNIFHDLDELNNEYRMKRYVATS